VEQAGKLQLGNLELAEEIMTLEGDSDISGESKVSFSLTGAKSPLQNFVFNQAIRIGGVFSVSVAVSGEGGGWSEDRILKFRIENGYLYEP
jgi:hypothetical protein